jgi:hypothetical protein
MDLAAIAPLFWDYKDRTVVEGGAVLLFGKKRFEPADQESFAALMPIVTEKIKVACDPANVAEAIAFDASGKRFLGRLRCQEMMVHGETSVEQIRASMRLRRIVYRAHKNYAESLERSRAAAGDVTLLDSLKRRAERSAMKPVIHALPVPRAVNAAAAPRLRPDDIADSFLEEN